MKQICTICVRGGSKGVANKNIRPLNGVPLIVHSLLQARKADIFDVIAVSSDSDEILQIANENGADYCIKRPDHLATDKAAKIPVIRHCVQEVEKITHQKFDICVDLDATSPLRTTEDIENALKIFKEKKHDNLFSVCPAHRSPYFNLVEHTKDGHIKLAKGNGLSRRQDAPKCYDMNASIYIWKRDILEQDDSLFLDRTGIYIMPQERSFDIDNEIDFEIVEFLMSKSKA